MFSAAPACDFGPASKKFVVHLFKKSRAKIRASSLTILRQVTFHGHISCSHFGKSRLSRFQVLSAYLRRHFSSCYGVWVG
jgi:hypothetical protein